MMTTQEKAELAHEEKLGIVAQLMEDGPLFDDDDLDESRNEKGEKLYCINMNDVFAWGCADGEEVTLDELMEAYKYAKASENEWNGWIEWVAQRRDEPPQIPVIISMARRQKGELRIPWYSKYHTSQTSKLWELEKAVEAGATIEEVHKLLVEER